MSRPTLFWSSVASAALWNCLQPGPVRKGVGEKAIRKKDSMSDWLGYQPRKGEKNLVEENSDEHFVISITQVLWSSCRRRRSQQADRRRGLVSMKEGVPKSMERRRTSVSPAGETGLAQCWVGPGYQYGLR